MSICWFPADHCYEGTCDGQLVRPHYETMPDYVRVYDIAVRHSGWTRDQRKLWRKARDRALWRWFPDRVSAEPPVRILEKGLVRGDYLPQGITLDVFATTSGYSNNSYGGFGLAPLSPPETAEYDPSAWVQGKGFALINRAEVNNAFRSLVTGRLTGVICHEVGHAFGFGHGGTGIMESEVNPPYHPDEWELYNFDRYWGKP